MANSACLSAQGSVPLAAAFSRPPLASGHIIRPRLCAQLNEGLSGRLLLLCAPAGFGKSSLASEFCQQLKAPWRSLWLSLSERDQDPGRFLERLCQALRQHCPTLGEETLALLRLRQRHSPFSYESCLESLINELQLLLSPEQPLLLVFDDYHLAQNEVLDHCLQLLLNHQPPGLLLLFTSRKRPHWPLARLRLARQVLELTEHDLRLTDEEARALLAGQGATLDAAEQAQLLARSEGWAAGLHLHWLAHRSAGSSVQGGSHLIHDYLLEEVIEHLAPELQQFLADTAVFERFCAPLCDALRERHDSARLLADLREQQVFLVPLDEQGQWFRYHHLFSDLLQQRALSTHTHLHLRACRWFHNQGLLDEAIEQALLAGQPDMAASLVQHFSEEQLLAEQNVTRLLRWKMSLPDQLLLSTPRLIVLYSWALALAYQLEAAEDLLSELTRFLPMPSAEQQRELISQWLALSGRIAYARGQAKLARQHAQAALRCLPDERLGPRLVCWITLANQALEQGELNPARSWQRSALELAQRSDKPLFEAFIHHERATCLLWRGQSGRALQQVELGLERLNLLPCTKKYGARARLLIDQGRLLALRGDEQQALAALEQGIVEAKSCRDIALLCGYTELAELKARSGYLAEAFAHLVELERLMHLWDVPAVVYLAILTLSKCSLWLRQKQWELAETWLQRLAETYLGPQATAAPEQQLHLALNIVLQQAQLSYLRHDDSRCLQQLAALERLCVERKNLYLKLHCQLLKLRLGLRQGELEAAAQLLEQLLQESDLGSCGLFTELLDEHPRWFFERLNLLKPSALRDQLLSCLAEYHELPSAASEPCSETLSSREQAVLTLIAQGCSNQEISEKLFISLHTVKSHARHINSKLGVSRRTQAVACAKRLGLLS